MTKPVIHASKIEMLALDQIKPYPKNARIHSDAQIASLAAIIRDSGFTSPVLIDPKGVCIAGHGRVLAAKAVGLAEVPCVRVTGLTAAQVQALRISDNAVGLASEWSMETLRSELAELSSIGFDVSLTGFGADELSDLLSVTVPANHHEDAPASPSNPVSRVGDVWLCGPHRIMCGSGLDEAHLAALLAGTIPDLANCDPPYGVNIVKRATDGGPKQFGKVGGGKPHPFAGPKARSGRGHGQTKKEIIMPGLYDPIIGDDTTETAVAAHGVLARLKVPAIVMWGGNYYADKLPPSRCWLVWDKENTGTFADVELAWTNQDAVARLLRHQWSGLIKASERGEKRTHPTQKPVALAEWVHETVAPKAKSVVDLFLGSGSALIAAERKRIRCFGMELAPPYVDVSVLRWAANSQETPRLEATGQTFAEVKAERHAAPKRKPRRAAKVVDQIAS